MEADRNSVLDTIQPGDIFEAHALGSQTLVGVGREERPSERGNCFGVFRQKVTRDDIIGGQVQEYRIVNFNVENLNALMDLGLTWPIQCKLLAGNKAVIHDPRIGERWYDKQWCEVCCPQSLLPIPQRQAQERDVMSGNRVEHENCVSINFKPRQFP